MHVCVCVYVNMYACIHAFVCACVKIYVSIWDMKSRLKCYITRKKCDVLSFPSSLSSSRSLHEYIALVEIVCVQINLGCERMLAYMRSIGMCQATIRTYLYAYMHG